MNALTRTLLAAIVIVVLTLSAIALLDSRDVVPTDKPADMCMTSARINGLEGEIYADDITQPEGDDGCKLYTCSVVSDSDNVRRYYTVEDCGAVVRLNP